jgi:hypothetical protein
MWYLADPTAGSYNIEVTFTEAITNSGAGAVSMTGCDTLDNSTSVDTQAKSSSPSTSLTPVAANSWIVDAMTHDARSTAGAVTGDQTAEFVDFDNGGSRNLASYGGPHSASSAYSWSTGFDSWCHVVASFSPAGAAPGRTTRNTDAHVHGVRYGMSFWMPKPRG